LTKDEEIKNAWFEIKEVLFTKSALTQRFCLRLREEIGIMMLSG
jgi:hypothetical protein